MPGWEDETVFWPDLTLEAVEEDVTLITTAQHVQTELEAEPEVTLIFDQVDFRLSQLRYCLDAGRAESLLVMTKTLQNPQFQLDDLCITSRPTISLKDTISDSEDESVEDYISRCLQPTLPSFIASEHFPFPDEAQNAKDLARDVITINSSLMRGSSLSYFEMKSKLVNITGSEDIARRALSAASRTFSGGICFQRVIDLFQPPASFSLFIIPESTEAAPLEIFACENRALVRAHTRYSVRNTEESKLVVFDAWLIAEIGAPDSRGVVYISSH